MGKIIKLKESDIAKIVQRILKEEKGKKEEPTSKKDLTKLSNSQFKKLMKKYGMDKSNEGLQKGYSKMYGEAPKWAKVGALTPNELKQKISNLPPDEEPVVAGMLILAIFAWTIVAWSFATWLGWEHSDVRLKENINRTGVSKSGIPIYTFNYKNDDTLWSGTMAQDLLDMGIDGAVATMDSGYYAVNYNMIDVDMVSL